MRIKYSKFAKLFGLVVFFLFVIPYLLNSDKKPLRSSIDLERQIDLAFKNEGLDIFKKDVAVQEDNNNNINNNNNNNNNNDNQNSDFETVFKDGVIGNYEPTNLEPRSGPGENGEGVVLDASENEKAQRLIGEFGFNMVASDKISLDRRIKDTRPAECKYWHYPSKLPTASVVIVFHNEGWSTLMRTVHSVINTSPPELLADIVLVDDFSSKDHLKKHLEDYITRFNGKVTIVRTQKREGLVQARVIGAENSKGDVIVILDAHCECSTNWLPPLLARIKLNRKALAVPIVDGIDWNTIEHQDIYGGSLHRGIFEWGFLYKESEVPAKESEKHQHNSEPYWSPTHAGGLLAIEKNWFFELGGYDPGIKIWGAEQYELSFKVWQCGGVVEWVPCSHVAHIYRGPRTESIHPAGGNPFQSSINHMRLAHVWMDEYKKYFFIRSPEIQKLDYGDISAQVALREKLQCKPFKWFMENVAYDLVKKFPLPPDNKVWGEVKNNKHNICLDTKSANFGQPIGVSGCHGQMGNQLFRLNVEGELSSGEHCFISDKDIVKKKFCLDYQGIWNPIGEWKYDDVKKQIYSTKEKKCLETDGQDLKLSECKDNDSNQQWDWTEKYHQF